MCTREANNVLTSTACNGSTGCSVSKAKSVIASTTSNRGTSSNYFGEEEFERGNLDAGRLSWLFGREVVPAEDPFDPESYEAMLKIDRAAAEASFPDVFAEDDPFGFEGLDDDGWDDE